MISGDVQKLTNGDQQPQLQQETTQQPVQNDQNLQQQQQENTAVNNQDEIEHKKILDYATSIASKQAFAKLLAENQLMRPLLLKSDGTKDYSVYLEFTPNFMSLIRVGKHGPYDPKFFYHELYKLSSKAKLPDDKFNQRKNPKQIERQMQSFSKHAVRAEELLHQDSSIDMNNLSEEDAAVLLDHTLEMFKDVEKYIGAAALEREGYLFVHVTALRSMKMMCFHQSSANYPPLKLSDLELDRLKLRVDKEFQKKVQNQPEFSDDGSIYNSYNFPDTDQVEQSAVSGEVHGYMRYQGPIDFQFRRLVNEVPTSVVVEELITMAKAMTKLQASLECHFPIKNDIEIECWLRDRQNANDIMDDPHIQRCVEAHKMKIVTGMTNLTRVELHDYRMILESLYQTFGHINHAYGLSLVSVLRTGMGLLNLGGRIAFCQALNQYAATVLQLLWGECDTGKLDVPIILSYMPNHGDQIVYPTRHEAKLYKAQFLLYKDQHFSENKQEMYRYLLKQLSAKPRYQRMVFSEKALTDFYKAVRCLNNNTCMIRSLPEKKSDINGKPPQRIYCIFLGKRIEPYDFKLVKESGNDNPIDVRYMKKFLAVSLNGGNICEYRLPRGAHTDSNYKHVAQALEIDDQVMELIVGWISQAYIAVKGEFLPYSMRDIDDDIQILAEFHRMHIYNQDTTNIATQIEQVAFNQQSRNKLLNMLGPILGELHRDKRSEKLLSPALCTCIRTSDDSIFYIDHMARAFLLGAKILQNDSTLYLMHYLDTSIFTQELTYDELQPFNMYMKTLVDQVTADSTPRKREKKKEQKNSGASESPNNPSESPSKSPTPRKRKIKPKKKKSYSYNDLIAQQEERENQTDLEAKQQDDDMDSDQEEEQEQEQDQMQESEQEQMESSEQLLDSNEQDWGLGEKKEEILQLLQEVMLDETNYSFNYVSVYNTVPMVSEFLRFKRLELFSVLQQDFYGLGLEDQDLEVACIEWIVREYMRQNGIAKLSQLHRQSKNGDDDVGYYSEEQLAQVLADRNKAGQRPIDVEQRANILVKAEVDTETEKEEIQNSGQLDVNNAAINQEGQSLLTFQQNGDIGWSASPTQLQLSQKDVQKVELSVEVQVQQQKNPFALDQDQDSYGELVLEKKKQEQLQEVQAEVNGASSDKSEKGDKKEEVEKKD